MILTRLAMFPMEAVYKLLGRGNPGECGMLAVLGLIVWGMVEVVLSSSSVVVGVGLGVWFALEFAFMLFAMMLITLGGLGKR